MRTGAARVIAALAVLGTIALAPAAAAGPRDDFDAHRGDSPRVLRLPALLGHRWHGDPPYVAGATTYSRGEWIHQDRPFDDTGADTFPDTTTLALQDLYPGLCESTAGYRHGEYTYPADEALARNGADLVELRAAIEGDSLHVLVVLQTLIDPNKAAVRLVFGGSRVVMLRGTTATLDGLAVPAAADAASNVLEVKLPVTVLPAAGGTIAVAVGVPVDGQATTWVDTAFVEEPLVGELNCWNDKAQSVVLAGATLPTATIDLGRLRAGATDPPSVRRGPMVRLHPPSFAAGEGITPEPSYGQGSTASVYRGSLQPYATYVPQTYDPAKPAPLLMLLHCLNCNHMTFHIAAWPGLRDLAEALGAIVVTPLAYGEARHYEHEAEVDVFDVLADISSRYAVDPDRLILSGMSMGSLGTYKLGLLHPDLWARTLGIGNYTTPICVSPTTAICGEPNYFRFFENARNLPLGILNGDADELTPVTLSREYAARLTELGYTHRFWEYRTARHNPALHGLTVDATLPWLQAARRITDPHRVTYRVDRRLFDPALGLTYDHAYWVRDIRLADGVDTGVIDATAPGGTATLTSPFSATGSDAAGSWTATGADPVLTTGATGTTVKVTATGIASATLVNVPGASPGATLTLDVTTDRALSIRVVGAGAIAVPAGRSEVTVSPTRRPAGQLPATGSSTGIAPWVLLASAVVLLRVAGRAAARARAPR